ncbi:putative lipid II flippase MurJ [Candidatus Ecksteinia adelgidicola]|nr:putative lipid II flippase MurJ [Candidatus Ecksteinia adelgidicola]
MNLFKSLAIVSIITIFSRLLGFSRDTVIAKIFGASVTMDAFFVAFKIPNFLRRIFAEGAFSQAFIPILSEYKNQKNKEETRNFIAHVSGALTLVLIVITTLGILIAPWIIFITAPGFVHIPDMFILTIALLRIIFPYILFISLASLAGAILNTWNHFSVPAFMPAFLNISIISCALFTSSYFHPQVKILAWSVIGGGILQLIYQLPYLFKIGMLVFPQFKLYEVGVWRVIRQMGPAILGVSVSQISLVINTLFSSFLISGSVSWIYYADRLMEFPSGVLGVALNTILSPLLIKSFSINDDNEYSRLIDWGLRVSFLLALPSAIALSILAKPLIITLFQYGKFSAFDTEMTKNTLIAYSIGLIGLILVKILAQSFYSRQETKTPVKIAIISLIMTQIMNLVFLNTLKHVGLALSIALAASVNAMLLYWKLRQKKIFQPQPGWLIFFIKLGIAVLVMTGVLIGFIWWLMPCWDQGNMLERLLRLLAVIIIGMTSYFSILACLGLRIKNFEYKIN